MPGVIDEVITLALLRPDAPAEGDAAAAPAKPFRAFVTHTDNAWGYPAKDRSGRLDALEEPHLGKLIAKTAAPRKPVPLAGATTQPNFS